MLQRKNISPEKIIKMFKKHKVLTLSEINKYLKCSRHSAKYHIKKYGAVTSFNHNSKYYSLPEIMTFDEAGLWEYNNVCFSKYGTLKRTIIEVVTHSTSGIAGDKLCLLTKKSLSSILAKITDEKQLKREKRRGYYVYFSVEEDIFKQQYQERRKEEAEMGVSSYPAHIFSLIERINQPSISIAEINSTLQLHNISALPNSIETFFSVNNINGQLPRFHEVELLRELIDKTRNTLSLSSMFLKEPTILFEDNSELNQCCGTTLKPYKTKLKKVYTLHIGVFFAYEKLTKCDDCGRIYKSQELSTLIPEGGNYGYDVIANIGELMFFEHKQAKEIKIELEKRNIPISVSEVEYLSKKFIIYLATLQEKNNSGIIEVMDSNGGYILHIDALGGAKGGQRLISGVDSISDFVLGNAKIKSENSLDVTSFLNNIKKHFGKPLVVVQDMGRGIMKAVREVFPNTPILICHFHFLRDIGKDLLEEKYDIIRKRLRHFGFLTKLRGFSKELKSVFEDSPENINKFCSLCSENKKISLKNDAIHAVYFYTLIEWILDWKSESNGYGFPFDRPHLDLALRIKKVLEMLDLDKYVEKKDSIACRIGIKLETILETIVKDTQLNKAIIEILIEIQFFDKLRDAMRIAEKNETDGLNDDGKNGDIKTIEVNVNKFIFETQEKISLPNNKKKKAFIKQLKKYRKQLFSDPIKIKTSEGIKKIQPQRTNNLMERMFRDFTSDNKRKTGTDSIGNTIQGMIADTPLIRNLKNDNYRKIIIGEKEDLAQAFSGIDIEIIRNKMREHAIYNEKIPKKIKALLQKKSLLANLKSAKNTLTATESN